MMRGVALALLVAAMLIVAQRWGSFVAGGSDSSCYALQAERWAAVLSAPWRESVQRPEPLALIAPWPDASATFAPTGHVASPTIAGAAVPICPAGLSMLMAPFRIVGGRAAMFFVVPLFGALLVVASYVVGSRYGAHVGLASALLTAASPIVLYQVVQPMSDVPAAALWMLAIAGATGTKPKHVVLAGIATSLAILVRPNLLPLGFVLGLYLLLRPERSWSQRLRAGVSYAAWCIPGCVAVGLIQWTFYGSPLSSGYGSLDALFAGSHVAPNLERYASWLWHSHTPLVLIAVAAPFLLPGASTGLLAAMIAVTVALYLPYVVFENWSFLRFLLPAIPPLLVLVAATIDAALRRAGVTRSAPIVGGIAAGLAVMFVLDAANRQVFRLHQFESRFERAGTYVADRLPRNALLVTSYESGSVRFYAGRPALVWDALDPAWLDRALAFVRDRGFEPYLMFERREEADFRARFAGSALGTLDWPPMVEIASQVRIYRPEDREAYRAGVARPTEYVR